jgi:hypothetical protein
MWMQYLKMTRVAIAYGTSEADRNPSTCIKYATDSAYAKGNSHQQRPYYSS